MLDMLGLTSDQIIVWGAALGALVSVLAAGLPWLRRQDRQARLHSVIEYRQALLAQEKARLDGNGPGGARGPTGPATGPAAGDTRRSVADLFRLERLAGGRAARRDRLAAAGLRRPQHALIFLAAQLVLPVILTGLTLLGLTLAEPGIPEGVGVALLLGAAALGYGLPGLMVRNRALKRQEEVRLNFPDALDLMLVCVEGGLGIEAGIARVSRDIGPTSRVLAEEFGLLGAELAFLGERQTALRNFSRRVGSQAARSFANALIQAEKYGTPLGQALRVLATEMRDKRMAEAEKKAAALPPKLTVPMIAFFMPTLFVVILGPAIIQVLTDMAAM